METGDMVGMEIRDMKRKGTWRACPAGGHCDLGCGGCGHWRHSGQCDMETWDMMGRRTWCAVEHVDLGLEGHVHTGNMESWDVEDMETGNLMAGGTWYAGGSEDPGHIERVQIGDMETWDVTDMETGGARGVHETWDIMGISTWWT